MKTHAYLLDIKSICMDKHLTVDEIFEKLKKKYPKIGRSTVYRNVEEMKEIGVLTKLTGIQDKALYEVTKENHIHLIDTKNKRVMDLYMDSINIPGVPPNFNIEYMNVDIYGKFE